MRSFVFEPASGTARRQYVRFAGVNLVGFTQVWLISVGLVRLVFPAVGFAWNAETVAHLIGIASLVPTSFFAHKYFSFKRDTARPAAIG
jgi:putative flippase GtrA